MALYFERYRYPDGMLMPTMPLLFFLVFLNLMMYK